MASVHGVLRGCIKRACLYRLQRMELKELTVHQSGLKIILNEKHLNRATERHYLNKPPENTATTDCSLNPLSPQPSPEEFLDRKGSVHFH